MPSSCASSRMAQRGQSMAEFLIALIVMVPLYLAVDYAGKYGDLHQTAVQASRYAAFQRVLEPNASKLSDSKIEDQTRARFFLHGGLNGGRLDSDDTAVSISDDTDQPPMWKDNGGNALLAQPSQVSVRFAQVAMSPPASVGWAIEGLAWTADQSYTGGRQAQVELNLVNKMDMISPAPIELKIGAATAAVAGGWGSSGSTMTEDKAATIVPTSMIPSFLSDFIELAISFFEPSGPEFGCIKPDVVAPDRLAPFSGTEGC